MLKRYVRLFDPAIVGVTGSQKALDPVYAAYHAWYMAVPVNHGPNDYSVAHGTRIYYVARDGSMKGFGDYADGPAQMIQNLRSFNETDVVLEHSVGDCRSGCKCRCGAHSRQRRVVTSGDRHGRRLRDDS
jgi:hypothetical protein